MTLQEQADKLGITKQAVWMRTEKGKAYRRAYHKAYNHKINTEPVVNLA